MPASRPVAAGAPAAAALRRGRPRSERARRAILAAAAELLLDQKGARMSIAAVAERAGVSKATIYRWWPSKEMLALDALLDWSSAEPPPDTGSLRQDLLADVLPFVREIRGRPFGRVIAELAAEAQSDEQFGVAYRRHFVEQRRVAMRGAFERAAGRGEVPANLDVEAMIDLIYGPLYHRVVHGHAPLTDRFATLVVDTVLEGIGP